MPKYCYNISLLTIHFPFPALNSTQLETNSKTKQNKKKDYRLKNKTKNTNHRNKHTAHLNLMSQDYNRYLGYPVVISHHHHHHHHYLHPAPTHRALQMTTILRLSVLVNFLLLQAHKTGGNGGYSYLSITASIKRCQQLIESSGGNQPPGG